MTNRMGAGKSMGDPIATDLDLPVETESYGTDERVPGFGWTLRPETVEILREIEENSRIAEQTSGWLIVG